MAWFLGLAALTAGKENSENLNNVSEGEDRKSTLELTDQIE